MKSQEVMRINEEIAGWWIQALYLTVGFSLWLFSHPYWGIWHDARVYTLMAVRWINPEAFARDPWFMFGSQDNFSIFSPIYGTMITLFGVDAATKWAAFFLGFLFVVGSWIFSRTLPLGRMRNLVFLLLVSVQLVYSINDFGFASSLRISESFVTSRHISVAFALVGLGLIIRHSWTPGILALTIACLLHPLMGIWTLLISVGPVLRLRRMNIAILAGIACALLLGASLSGVWLFRPLQGEWAAFIHDTARIVFVSHDGSHRLAFAVACYSILLLGSRWGTLTLRAWYFSTLLVCTSAYGINWFCSEFAPAMIVMQLQMWRANWLALVFAVVAVVDVSYRAYLRNTPRRVITMLSWAAILTCPWLAAIASITLALMPVRIIQFIRRLAPKHRRVFEMGIRITFFSTLLMFLFTIPLDLEMAGMSIPGALTSSAEWTDILRGAKFTGAYGLVALMTWLAFSSPYRKIVTTASLLIFVAAISQWDGRSASRRAFEEYYWGAQAPSVRPFGSAIRPNSTVYWQSRAEHVWFSLRTASYASSTQAIGIVFSEPMTREISRRLQRLALANADKDLLASNLSMTEKMIETKKREQTAAFNTYDLHFFEAAELSIAGLKFLCADPALDYVVHDKLFPLYATVSAEEVINGKVTDWILYDCERIRDSTD